MVEQFIRSFFFLFDIYSRILAVPSADEFYMTMGTLTQEMLDEGTSIMEADAIIKVRTASLIRLR